MRISYWSSDVCSSDLALAARDVIGAPDLFDRTVDRVLDQFLMALAARQGAIDLRDDLAFGVIAVGIDRRHGADDTRRRPDAAGHMLGRRYPLTPLHQQPTFAAARKDGLQTFNTVQPLSPHQSHH